MNKKFKLDNETEEKLYYLAYYDYLTGLTNENYFHQHLIERIKNINENEKLIVLYARIRNLSEIINILGYSNSNNFIREIADKIDNSFLDIEIVSLYRGNQFLVLFSIDKNATNDYLNIEEKINKFLNELKRFVTNAGYDYLLKINIGVSIYPDHAENAEDLLSKAHHAMSLVDADNDNYKIYNEDIFLQKLYYESLKKDLEKAILNNEFFLEFQPKVDSFTEKIVAAEALLRWYHPKKGQIPPNEFIPMAIRSKYIKKIGVWVLEKAFETLKEWMAMGNDEIKICINLSSCELNDPDIIKQIEEVSNSYNVPNNLIELEITERTVINIPENALKKLKDLRFLIVLDDFGTGYSSLSYFGKLPVDILKLDKSFISNIKDWKTKTLVETVINLSHNFNVEVVGEGIETKKDLEILKKLNCDYIQGYYFYKPMSKEEIEKIL